MYRIPCHYRIIIIIIIIIIITIIFNDSEKYLANWKDVFWGFMDLEKAYDKIDRHGMWRMLGAYGVGGKLLKAVQSFSADSRECARLGNDVSEWLPVNVGLRQGCVMSP